MRKFRALRVIALIYRILAWITLVGGILAGFIIMILGVLSAGSGAQMMPGGPRIGVGGVIGGILSGLVIVLLAFLYFLLLYALGDFIYLGLAIEENTRETAALLRGKAGVTASEPPIWERPPSP